MPQTAGTKGKRQNSSIKMKKDIEIYYEPLTLLLLSRMLTTTCIFLMRKLEDPSLKKSHDLCPYKDHRY